MDTADTKSQAGLAGIAGRLAGPGGLSGPVQVEVHPSAVQAPAEHGPATADWYEELYRSAGGDISKVPWAGGLANRCVSSWLNAEAPGRVRPGSRAMVVGCGLGDNVAELISRGYDAQGFDVAPGAIEWARRRFPDQAGAFMVADLFNLPARLKHRFELVVECCTLQALHPSQREAAASAMASLLGPRGVLVAVARGRDDAELIESVKGPPWPLSVHELLGLFEACGLKPVRAADDFLDDETPPIRRVRAAFEVG